MCLWIKVLFSSAAVLNLSCAKPQAVVEAQLQDYFENFKKYTNIRIEGVSGILVSSVLYADCIVENKTVRINPLAWTNANEYERENIVFHELGHCAASLPHDNSLDSSGCPRSIMNEVAFWDSACYYDRRDLLFKRLKEDYYEN